MAFELVQQPTVGTAGAVQRGGQLCEPLGRAGGHAPSSKAETLFEKLSQSRRRPSSVFAPFAVSS